MLKSATGRSANQAARKSNRSCAVTPPAPLKSARQAGSGGPQRAMPGEGMPPAPVNSPTTKSPAARGPGPSSS